MARYDKYGPKTGGFRAPLAAAWSATSGPAGVTDLNRVIVVGLNASGQVVKATAAITAVGVLILSEAHAAGDIVDVMTSGEIFDLSAADIQGATPPVAGTIYLLDTTASRLVAQGATPTAGSNFFRVGMTVEAARLVVRCGLLQG